MSSRHAEPGPESAPDVVVPDEQQIYARALERWTQVSAVLLLLAFAAYVGGLLPPHVPMDQLPALWGQPVDRFLALSGSEAGWHGLALAGRGDALNLFGIALLSSGSPMCLLLLVPGYLRRRDFAHLAFTVAVVALMLLAASGLLGSGR